MCLVRPSKTVATFKTVPTFKTVATFIKEFATFRISLRPSKTVATLGKWMNKMIIGWKK